ncbi:CGNR zinc finger domain-containing protein [Streptomyces sp. SL13]|uniref:CGNR zinc finger domain-containing protein n=1 Tax=Streptantibioticus silvisoli TaxID=2705255 RepID=A0AA90HBU9_9ACTN|nr:CGNR zinc finger domain-containing protein [Streptantibioticus silvisoli]MDI5963817.1 CGNR zinc finger domain-containing protein [Streptantibioticus silvisoli]MDI5972800.1 CGNR zinc finger domain-containing protein [Streptantibioticus silvisoli]
MTRTDPRPLTGEPLSLDLLNTRWIDGGREQDLLADLAGLRIWLGSVRPADGCRADTATLDALRATRAALALAAAAPAAPSAPACAALDEVLAHGRIRRRLTAAGPAEETETDAPCWLPGWLAAADYLRLLALDPTRVHACEGPGCVLYFYDTSKGRRRRWCSMAACGNRAKASRHYARGRTDEA